MTLNLGHDAEIMAAFALYDPLVNRIMTPEQQTEAINRRAMARGHVIAIIANAAYEVAQSDFEDANNNPIAALDRITTLAKAVAESCVDGVPPGYLTASHNSLKALRDFFGLAPIGGR